mmetsp:Transcript_115152/g.287755  ORF Transcript_115152/g.287755 Transcript_115152/m.287755 type:complete len:209 (-) Transcript_115152:1357-1983(-)
MSTAWPKTSLSSAAAASWPSSCTRARNFPDWPSASNSAGPPNSATWPASRTKIRSCAAIVCSRCAMVRTVRSANSVLITSWIVASVLTSIFAVASSRQIIFDCRSKARARQTNWRSPHEKLSPPSWTMASRPPVSRFTASSREAWRKASQSCASVRSPKRSKFSRTLPANITASCGMMARPRRRSLRPSPPMSTPSILMQPSQAFAGE